MKTFLIVGLGNPGKKYEKTRHNVGFMAIDRIADLLHTSVNTLKWQALIGETRFQNNKVILVKPQTYMNSSGESVREILNFYKLDPKDLLILCDDIDISFASIRIKQKGSAGSHNGLKSIVLQIGSKDFPRIKIAVGKKPAKMDLADFVLSKFSSVEEKIIEEEIEAASQAALDFLEKGVDEAMNTWNSWLAPSYEEKNG